MDEQDLSKLYRSRFTDEQLARKYAIWKVICEDFLQKFVRPSDTVVDVACGNGEFLGNIRAARKIAVDLNPDVKASLGQEIEFHLSPALALGNVIRGEADVVFTSNFLEHLQDKRTLELFLDQVRVALTPSGHYVILGPNLRYLPGKYWDFYDHHLGLTHLSLNEVLQLRGFKVEVCIDRFLPYTTQGALPTSPWLVRAYLRFPPVWRLLGKQFLIVARLAE